MIAGAALFAINTSPASAQEPAAVSEIVVTGSRIVQPNMTATSPVQTVVSQEFQLQGRNNTADLLNTLPQVIQIGNADLSSTSNPLSTPGGVATVDLRGLGPQRTLVLVDGKRLGIGDPSTANTNPAPDINQIPAALIQRVDVLTGGASAVYGSDAVAGVVNFIMKRNFKGVQLDAQWSTYQHSQGNELMQDLQAARGVTPAKDSVWDGQAWDASVVFGVSSPDDRANITAFVTYRDQHPVKYARRDFANCQLNVDTTTTPPTPDCAGSSNSNIFYDATGAVATRYAVVGNRFNVYNRNAITSPPALFNSNPFEYLQHQGKRYTGGFFARYDINNNFNLYSDFSYMKDRSSIQIAPSGLFQGSGVTANAGFEINCNNPLLSVQQATTICTQAQIAAGERVDLIIGRRNIEGGPRTTEYEHENYRIVLGSRGDIAGPWKYDVYGQRYYTSLSQDNLGYMSLQRIQNALLLTRGTTGQPVCSSGGNCVPYNIFTEGGVTPEAVAYLNSSGSQRGSITQSILSGSVNGDLATYGMKSPWANDGVAVAFGGEYRKEQFVFRPDEASLSGDLSGFGGASTAVDQGFNVKEIYGEIRAPIAQQMAFAEELVLEAGYRYSDYSIGVTANTYKLGAQWAPVSDIRFRGSFQRAIRAPNVIELFLPQSVTNTSDVSIDPCSGTAAAPAIATLAQCVNTGVSAAQYGNGGSTNTIPQCPSGQCAVLNGGNLDLRPEKANTYSIGFTTRPSFIPGFTASIDYFNIKLKDQITSIPLAVALSNCLQTGNATFCSLINRAPNGILFGTSVSGGGYISGTVVNIGAAQTSGLDFQASYNLPLTTLGLDDYGTVAFNFNGSYLIDSKTTPLPGEPTYDCAGLFGNTCDGIFPIWRHTVRATWNSPWKVQLSVAWRHLGPVSLETNSDDPTLGNGTFDAFNDKLGARNYIDLAAVWNVRENISLRAGVTNVFDKDPPLVNSLIAGTGTPNTYTAYDTLGRRLFVALSANF
jgi:outer membrane receptor protein involved in Fe transport